MSTGVFGPAIDSQDVEEAVIAFLEEWMPTYVPELRRKRDPTGTRWPDGIAPISSYTVDVDDLGRHRWPEDQLPAIVVGSPGEEDDPRIEGSGRATSYFQLAILAVAEGGGDEPEADAKALARIFAGAARLAIAQHPDLACTANPEGFSSGVTLKPGRNDVITRGVDAQRTLAGCAYPFVLDVSGTMDVSEGPREPLPDPENPPDEWPHVKEDGAHLEVEQGASKVEELRAKGFFD